MTHKVALLIDLPNIFKSLMSLGVVFDARPIFSYLRKVYGEVEIRNAYAFFGIIPISIQTHLVNQEVALIQCPPYTTDNLIKKGIHEVLDDCPWIDTLVLGSGDGHFIEEISEAKRCSKRTVVLSVRHSLSKNLRNTVDTVIYWPVAA